MTERTDIRNIGILTGGGDCPGLNAAIRAVVVKAHHHGIRVMGIQRGWWGLLNAEAVLLTLDDVQDIHKEGGTILGSSRTNVYKTEDGPTKAMEGFRKLGIDALIAIGGEDTLGVAAKLTKAGMPTIALPKTIDKDLSATDTTIGFNTAVTIATDAIDRIHTTMRSHHRIGVVEIMGRHAGWMALMAGMASGAQAVLIPEEKFDLDEIAQIFIRRKEQGKDWGVIAVAEGAQPTRLEGFATQDDSLDSFGHVKLGGIGKKLAKEIEKRRLERQEKTATSSQWVIEQLNENHQLARVDDDIGQSTRALELIGKHHGTFNADASDDKEITINIKMPDRGALDSEG